MSSHLEFKDVVVGVRRGEAEFFTQVIRVRFVGRFWVSLGLGFG